MTVKVFKDEREMRATLIEEKIAECVRIQKLKEKINEMERTDNPDRYDAIERLLDRATADMEKRVERMSFPQVMNALLPY